MKSRILRLGISFLVGFAIFTALYFARIGFFEAGKDSTFRCLSDAALGATLVLGGFGVLKLCARGGTFDILAFGVKKLVARLRFKQKQSNQETFFEYRQRRMENTSPVYHLLISGAFFLVLTIIFTVVFYSYL